MDEIVLVHRKKAPATKPLKEHPLLSQGQWLHAETCLRELSFGLKSQFEPEDLDSSIELYEGAALYNFCIQMACGLFSPIIGETEVFGQFRSFFAPEKLSNLDWAGQAESFSQKIFSDVKALRQQYLIGIGSQSYGSFARRFVPQTSPVLVIGGGQLAQEIIPWVGKQKRENLDVLVRRADNAQEIQKLYPYVTSHTWDNFSGDLHTLVIAAPISAVDLKAWLDDRGLKAQRILDLREESAYDDLSHLCEHYCALKEVFTQMETTKEKLGPILIDLHADLEKRVQSQISRASYRPFGWDDICA